MLYPGCSRHTCSNSLFKKTPKTTRRKLNFSGFRGFGALTSADLSVLFRIILLNDLEIQVEYAVELGLDIQPCVNALVKQAGYRQRFHVQPANRSPRHGYGITGWCRSWSNGVSSQVLFGYHQHACLIIGSITEESTGLSV